VKANREKVLKEVERSIGAGKIDAALAQLRRLPDTHPNDFPVLNRMGDLLARAGRKSDAVFCYQRIAQTFAHAGFVPKAIALYKKILRLEPNRTQSLVELGNLFLKQELPGEARPYLLRAAEVFMARGEVTGAREVYERMANAEPRDPHHRARLAEACAAAGDHERAVDELAAVGGALLSSGKADEAEKAYRRAAEIRPDAIAATVGLADCQRARGELNEAIATLSRLSEQRPDDAGLRGKLVLYRQEAGRLDEALAALFDASPASVADDVFETVFGVCREQDRETLFWQRFDPFAERIARDDRGPWLADVLSRLAGTDPDGNVGALERWLELAREDDDPAVVKRVLARLTRCYDAHGMEEQAAAARSELKSLEPADSSPAAAAGATETAPEPAEGPPPEPEDDPALQRAEAPPVPLGRSDEEFVAGRLTQAEILEKYGLIDQALEQLRELTERFPGHVPAQERRVELLRARGVPAELRDALVDLALARRAAGDADGARLAVRQARRNAPLEASVRNRLQRLSLLDSEARDPAPATPAAAPAAVPEEEDATEVVIDFDTGDGQETPLEATPEETAEETPEETLISVPGLDEDDDLSALTAALESQIFDEQGSEPVVPEQESQQSLEEVFAAFREHVRDEVGSDDHKTHYDLGIGYKEMGLLDEAIAEFEQALGSEQLSSEAATMLAVCRREKGEPQAAAEWYRKALEAPGVDAVSRITLSYDLAEVLLEAGSAREALDLYRTVLEADPSYRDVRNRVRQLESRLGH